mgnify:FL=1
MGLELAVLGDSTALLPHKIIQELTKKVESIMTRAQGLAAVENQEPAAQAGILVQDIGPIRKFIKEVCGPVCDDLDKKHKAATGLRKFFDAPMASLELKFQTMISDFFMERERERKKQEAILQVQRDKEHKKEVRVIAGTVAIQSGMQAAAEIREEMGDAPPVILEKIHVAGMNLGTVWHAEVIDSVAFVKGLASGKIPISMFDAEASSNKVDKQAADLDGKIDYPGVRIWEGAKIRRNRR